MPSCETCDRDPIAILRLHEIMTLDGLAGEARGSYGFHTDAQLYYYPYIVYMHVCSCVCCVLHALDRNSVAITDA